MHGLLLRPVQGFVRDIYGQEHWLTIASGVGIARANIEPMGRYPDDMAELLITAATAAIGKPRAEFLEDLGTYLVSHPNCETVRRLMRFGGDTFLEFLYSLNDLPARARLAVTDLQLPELDLREHFSGSLTLGVSDGPAGAGDVMVGLLRGMADDYGALVMLQNLGANSGVELIEIRLLDLRFSEGRAFQLAPGR